MFSVLSFYTVHAMVFVCLLMSENVYVLKNYIYEVRFLKNCLKL